MSDLLEQRIAELAGGDDPRVELPVGLAGEAVVARLVARVAEERRRRRIRGAAGLVVAASVVAAILTAAPRLGADRSGETPLASSEARFVPGSALTVPYAAGEPAPMPERGERLAAVSAGGVGGPVVIYRDGTYRRVRPEFAASRWLTLSPDGRWLGGFSTSRGRTGLVFVNVETGARRWQADIEPPGSGGRFELGTAAAVRWSADSAMVYLPVDPAPDERRRSSGRVITMERRHRVLLPHAQVVYISDEQDVPEKVRPVLGFTASGDALLAAIHREPVTQLCKWYLLGMDYNDVGPTCFGAVRVGGEGDLREPATAGTVDPTGRVAVLGLGGPVATQELLARPTGATSRLLRLDVPTAHVTAVAATELEPGAASVRGLVTGPWWHGLPLALANGEGYRLVGLDGDRKPVVSVDARLRLGSLTVAQWVLDG